MADVKQCDKCDTGLQGEQGPKGDWNKIFGWNVRYLRKERSLTQKNLGVLLGVHGSTISNWETHKIIPYSSTLSNIANLFEVTVDELIFKERLKLDWKTYYDSLSLRPIKSPQCITSEIEK